MVAFYLIIRGPLGIGKSTVTRELCQRLGATALSIDQILEEHGLEEWEDGFISEDSFRQANAIAAHRAEKPLTQGSPVIFDGNFYWKSQIEDLVARLPYPHEILTLDAPLAVCIARDAGRAVSLGSEGATQVYQKSTAFQIGVLMDATGPLSSATQGILEHVARSGLAQSRWD